MVAVLAFLSFSMLGLAFLLVAVVAQQPASRWDTVDVEPVLKNERVLKTYFKCFMDQGRCSPEATEFKKVIPDVLENDCSKCSEKEKQKIGKVIKHLLTKKPDMFRQLERKYDPEGVFRKKYEEEKSKGSPSAIFGGAV